MLHPVGRRGHFIGPNGVRYKGGFQSIHRRRRGRYVVRRRRSQPALHMSNAAAARGARR